MITIMLKVLLGKVGGQHVYTDGKLKKKHETIRISHL